MKTVRVTSPRDIITAIPALVGFVPTESLVLVLVHDNTVLVTARLDLDGIEEGWYDAIAPMLNHVYANVDANASRIGILSVVFTEGDPDRPRPWKDVLRFAGHPIMDDLWVRGALAGSYICQESCCPFPNPVGEVSDIELVTGEVVVRQTREERAACVAYVGPLDAPDLPPVIRPDSVVEVLTMVVKGEREWNPRLEAVLTFCLRIDVDGPHRRDRILAGLAVADVTVPEAFIVSMAQHTEDTGVLGALGALAYLRGDGALAWMLVERAQDNNMAGLISTAMSQGTPPHLFRDLLVETLPEVTALAGNAEWRASI